MYSPAASVLPQQGFRARRKPHRESQTIAPRLPSRFQFQRTRNTRLAARWTTIAWGIRSSGLSCMVPQCPCRPAGFGIRSQQGGTLSRRSCFFETRMTTFLLNKEASREVTFRQRQNSGTGWRPSANQLAEASHCNEGAHGKGTYGVARARHSLKFYKRDAAL